MARPTPAYFNDGSDQATGLIGWWPFSSGALVDWSGNGYDESTSVDITTESDPDFGTVAVFNGTSSYIALSNTVILPGSWTFAAWLKVNFWTANDNTRGRIFATGRNASNQFSYFYEPIVNVLDGGAGEIGRRFRNVLTSNGTTGRHDYTGPASPFEYSSDTWYHWACTRVSSPTNSRCKHYINGSLVTTLMAFGQPNVGTTFSGSGMTSYFGANLAQNQTDMESFFPGSMADVRLYSVVKDATQIAAMYAESTRWELYSNPNIDTVPRPGVVVDRVAYRRGNLDSTSLNSVQPNETYLTISSSSSTIQWQIRPIYSQNVLMNFTTTNSGISPSSANINFIDRTTVAVHLDRSVNYYLRYTTDDGTMSDWVLIELSGELRLPIGRHRNNTVVSETSRGATVRTTNPKWTETKTRRGATIRNNSYFSERPRGI